jgi:hypothetical protein
MVASVPKGLNRILSKLIAVLAVRGWERRQAGRGRQGKSAAFGPAHVLVGVEVLRRHENGHAVVALRNLRRINASSAVGVRKLAVRYHEQAR